MASNTGSRTSWLQEISVQILKQGPVPQHVGLIMDGNRRFARNNKYDKVVQGHDKGGDTFVMATELLIALGIKEISVYLFSLENFKRSEEEVAGLMHLIAGRLQSTLDDKTFMEGNRVRVEILGNYQLAPTDKLKSIFANAMLKTKDNNSVKLNFCFAYTGRDEICKSLGYLMNGLREKKLEKGDITEELFESTLSMTDYRPIDLLVRTSGETRLSDFMVWQAGKAIVEIIEKDWPALSEWDLLKAVLHYQESVVFFGHRPPKSIQERLKFASKKAEKRATSFLSALRAKQWQEIVNDSK